MSESCRSIGSQDRGMEAVLRIGATPACLPDTMLRSSLSVGTAGLYHFGGRIFNG